MTKLALFIYLISSARYIISAICLYIPQQWSNNETKRYLVPSSGQEWDKLGIKQVKDIFPFVRGKDERERVRMFEREREREREKRFKNDSWIICIKINKLQIKSAEKKKLYINILNIY